MKVLGEIRNESLVKYCDRLPFPVVIVDKDYNVILLNREASAKFPECRDKTKCYEITHGLNRPCWEIQGDKVCPVRRLQLGEEPFVCHEHGGKSMHMLVASRVEDDLFMELYLDKYVTQLVHDLKVMAETDSLTGVFSRRKLEEFLRSEVERCKRYHRPLSVLFIDVDNFKQINDTYGHNKGDEVLKSIAHVIRKETRKTDFVGRFGGEEFLIVLPETELDHAYAVAERIRKSIERLDFGVGRVSVSVGVTDLREDDDLESLFNRVDRAMYLAKEKGKNRSEIL